MDNEEQLFNDRYPEMLRMAQLLTSQADAVLIGSFGTYLTYPQVLSKRPHDVDLFIEGSLENIKKIIELLKENGYTVYSWQDEIGESFDYSILPGRFYIRGIKDGLYMDATYEIVDLNFDDIRKYAILVEDILALNKEGQIIVLDRSDREESAKRANLLKNLYLVSNMLIETDRLIIRDVAQQDGEAFIHMASDGSLNDIGFEKDCSSWMDDWIKEAQNLAREDNPRKYYLAYVIEDKKTGSTVGSVGCSYYEDLQKVGITYFIGADFRNNGYASEAIKAYISYFFDHYDENEIIATIREDNIPSWKTIERVGFSLTEQKMYKDINDAKEEIYRFYLVRRNG